MLHYSTEPGFLQVAKTLVKRYPGQLTVKTIAPRKKLINENHETPAYLTRMII